MLTIPYKGENLVEYSIFIEVQTVRVATLLDFVRHQISLDHIRQQHWPVKKNFGFNDMVNWAGVNGVIFQIPYSISIGSRF